ncbi:MAG TPA: hypothetical protein VJZ27_13385, partial [Aggregatilineales bacterium]|nr:hypothetical protein [Aggregatilineales bacterium]
PPPEDPDYREPAPYIMFAGQPNGVIEDKNITLTELGYRDAVPMPKPPDEFRIIILGGSTVFNGSPREVSIAGALESELHAQGYESGRIYNLGIFSTVSGQELATILFRAVDFDPDMILVYDGSNDLTEPYFFDPRPGYPFDFMANQGARRLIEGDYSLYDVYAVLLRPTNLGYTLFQFEIEEQITRRSQLDEIYENDRETWRRDIVTQYTANLSKMCRMASAFDFQFVAVLQPMIFFKDSLVGDEPGWQGSADYQNHTRAVYDLAREGFQGLNEQYSSEPCLFRDGSRMLASEIDELFVDPVHLNDSGNVIIGRRLAGILSPLLNP